MGSGGFTTSILCISRASWSVPAFTPCRSVNLFAKPRRYAREMRFARHTLRRHRPNEKEISHGRKPAGKDCLFARIYQQAHLSQALWFL